MANTHICRCQAGFVAKARRRFSFPAGMLPGWKLSDTVIFQECTAPAPSAIGSIVGGQQMIPNGVQGAYRIVSSSPKAPDGTATPTLTVERIS